MDASSDDESQAALHSIHPDLALPSASGELIADRWQRILSANVLARGQAVGLYGPSRERLVTRHPLNNKRSDQAVMQVKMGILQHGVLEDCRSSLILVPRAAE
eukprot:7835860-Pyramimonas_sp.AAC.1